MKALGVSGGPGNGSADPTRARGGQTLRKHGGHPTAKAARGDACQRREEVTLYKVSKWASPVGIRFKGSRDPEKEEGRIDHSTLKLRKIQMSEKEGCRRERRGRVRDP